ncbi:hypothetical protein O6P43_020925 [Quillaja saponaria]|uniref:Uncharacterized protein n=1 Tax=Quillaja saponaria TaxID=32244 RepID=A0AAD7PLR8_QUISA|nr:hypothetical protein O6P43_020925 [Quillaja saponaria]
MNNRGGYCYKYDEINYKVFENDQIERLARSAATENGMVFKKVVSSTQKEIPPAMEITLKASKDGKTGVYRATFLKEGGAFKLQEFVVKEGNTEGGRCPIL